MIFQTEKPWIIEEANHYYLIRLSSTAGRHSEARKRVANNLLRQIEDLAAHFNQEGFRTQRSMTWTLTANSVTLTVTVKPLASGIHSNGYPRDVADSMLFSAVNRALDGVDYEDDELLVLTVDTTIEADEPIYDILLERTAVTNERPNLSIVS